MQQPPCSLSRRRVLIATAMSAPALAHAAFDSADASSAYVKVQVKLETRKRFSKMTQGADLVLPVNKSTILKLPPREGTAIGLKLQPKKLGPSGVLLYVELSRGEPTGLLHQPDMHLLVPWDKATAFEFGHHDGETISLELSPSTLPAAYQPAVGQGPTPAA